MRLIKATVCLTEKMHRMAEWIYANHDVNLSQLTRAAFHNREQLEKVSRQGMSHSIKSFGEASFRTTLNLTPEVNSVINRIAKRKLISRSAVIRSVLYPHMQKYDPRRENAEQVMEVNNG